MASGRHALAGARVDARRAGERSGAAPMPAAQRAGLDTRSLQGVFGALTAIAVVFLVGPTIVMLLTSFTSTESLRFPPQGLSLRWYKALLDADQMQAAAWSSLVVAFWTTLISAVLGTLGALAIARSESRFARVADVVFMSPLILPALAYGFAALVYIHLLGFQPSIPLLVLGHVVVCVPFVLRTTIAALVQVDPALFDASASLGAGRVMTFRRVTLPLIGRGIAAGAFLAFMASFDNIPVSLFLTDARTEMLPIRMWGMLETRLDVRVAAISGLVAMATLVLLVLVDRLVRVDRQLR